MTNIPKTIEGIHVGISHRGLQRDKQMKQTDHMYNTICGIISHLSLETVSSSVTDLSL